MAQKGGQEPKDHENVEQRRSGNEKETDFPIDTSA